MTTLTQSKAMPVITDLTRGPVGPHLLKMTGSVLMGFVAAAVFNITDTWFVSKLGTNELAAMGFTLPVTMVVFGLTVGLAQGANATLSRAIGGGGLALMHELTLSAILLGLAFTGLAILVGLATLRPLFTAMGATAENLPLVTDYMRIWYLGMLFQVIPVISNNILRATGDMLSPSLIMIVSMGLNIVLDPLFIFGWGPVPALGMRGAAIATVISRGVSLAGAYYLLVHHRRLLSFQRVPWRRLLDHWREILYNGLPVAGVHVMMPAAMGVIVWIASRFGTEAVAAMSAGVRLEQALVIPIFAMGAASIPFGGQNWGSGQTGRVGEAHRFLVKMALVWGVACVALCYLAGGWIAGQFTREEPVYRLLMIYLAVMPLVFAFRGLNHIGCCLMNAIRYPLHAVAVTFARFFVFSLPLAWLGARWFGFTGFLISLVLADVLTGLGVTLWVGRLYGGGAASGAVEPGDGIQRVVGEI